MLKHGEVNPLNVHGFRELSHCPPHFERVQFDLYVDAKSITSWIYENLEGRFHIGQVTVSQSDTAKPSFMQTLVAFEMPGEASYFSLCLPQINQNTPW
jgi:hypothetical protein